MQVILREDVPGLGIIGDIVKVKPGYARNYLLPRNLAAVADPKNIRQLEHQKRIIAKKKARERSSHESVANAITGMVLEVESRAGKTGKLFGSVTNMDVGRLLGEKGYEIDRRRILLREPIKEIGEFSVSVRVGQDVTAAVKVVVKPVGGQLEDEPDLEATPAEEQPAPRQRRGGRRKAAPTDDAPTAD
jgi:large subunit ribosomal protein L9